MKKEKTIKPKDDPMESLLRQARAGLARLVAGDVTVEEKKTYEYVSGEQHLKSEVTTSKTHLPDLATIVFVLTNLDPARWRAKPVPESAPPPGDGAAAQGDPIDLSSLSEEALRELLNTYPNN